MASYVKAPLKFILLLFTALQSFWKYFVKFISTFPPRGVRDGVEIMATRYGLDGPRSNPGVNEIFRTRPYRPWGPFSFHYNGCRVFPGANCWPSTPFNCWVANGLVIYLIFPSVPAKASLRISSTTNTLITACTNILHSPAHFLLFNNTVQSIYLCRWRCIGLSHSAIYGQF